MARPILFVDFYEEAFLRNSHELVGMGWERLVPRELATLHETAITGMLCDAMEAALDDEDRPDWATQITTVDDQPESVRGKTGSHRPRTDVCIRCIDPRPARRFRFEAKRLHCDAALAAYLGEDGMLAVITGHYGELPRAGMVGYVQVDNCAIWSGRIKEAIRAAPKRFLAVVPVQFGELRTGLPEAVFWSEHEHGRPAVRKEITHVLLQCA